jgi:hypothetical protein
MTIPDTKERQQFLVLDYLYGGWDDAQKREFEQLLIANESLKQLLDDETRFDESFPVGTQPLIEQERLDGNRWLLRQNLQKASRSGFSVQKWLSGLAQRPFSVAFQGAAMAMTFVLGVMVASPDNGSNSQVPDELLLSAAQDSNESPLALISDADFDIYKLKVNHYDAATGDIDLSFSLASETRLSGNVADPKINQLMVVALQDDIDSASRLDTINALQPVVSGDKVYEALIYVLTNDQNPGVRYQAVRSLVALSDKERVRDALRLALQKDVNSGVRIEAFNALMPYRDEQTLGVFRVQMNADSSEYIRNQSRSIVEQAENNSITL